MLNYYMTGRLELFFRMKDGADNSMAGCRKCSSCAATMKTGAMPRRPYAP
jgi:hypothetical protein